MEIIKRKIRDLVGENLVFASVLYYFGIRFYEYSDKTLQQVCEEKGLDPQVVVDNFESEMKSSVDQNIKLSSYPIELIIEYLKHSHYIFIKKKLPFIARLIENLQTEIVKKGSLTEDLKLVFPLFVEDFIYHVYDEEDTLFSYIENLNKAMQKEVNPSKLYYQMETHSIQKYAMDHEMHEDEMSGIRKITNNYSMDNSFSLSLKVIISELDNFDKELRKHADIENKVLFPKALLLEKSVKAKLADKIKFN